MKLAINQLFRKGAGKVSTAGTLPSSNVKAEAGVLKSIKTGVSKKKRKK